MNRRNLSALLLILVIVFVVLAATTLVPYPTPMVSDLGYHTLCTFAPWSTLALLFLAGLGWIVRQYIETMDA